VTNNNPQQKTQQGHARNSPGGDTIVNVSTVLNAEQQIRALCIQAAATAIHGSKTSARGDAVISMAERFEGYIYAGSDTKPDA
jgi:hypothetical protein